MGIFFNPYLEECLLCPSCLIGKTISLDSNSELWGQWLTYTLAFLSPAAFQKKTQRSLQSLCGCELPSLQGCPPSTAQPSRAGAQMRLSPRWVPTHDLTEGSAPRSRPAARKSMPSDEKVPESTCEINPHINLGPTTSLLRITVTNSETLLHSHSSAGRVAMLFPF